MAPAIAVALAKAALPEISKLLEKTPEAIRRVDIRIRGRMVKRLKRHMDKGKIEKIDYYVLKQELGFKLTANQYKVVNWESDDATTNKE